MELSTLYNDGVNGVAFVTTKNVLGLNFALFWGLGGLATNVVLEDNDSVKICHPRLSITPLAERLAFEDVWLRDLSCIVLEPCRYR